MDSAGMNNEPRETPMQVALIHEPVLTVQASGEIDLANAGELEKALEDAVAQSPVGFVLDLSETTYVDSAGMAAILFAYSHLRPHNGSMAIVIKDHMLREIFDIVQFGSFPGVLVCDDCTTAHEFVSRRK